MYTSPKPNFLCENYKFKITWLEKYTYWLCEPRRRDQKLFGYAHRSTKC